MAGGNAGASRSLAEAFATAGRRALSYIVAAGELIPQHVSMYYLGGSRARIFLVAIVARARAFRPLGREEVLGGWAADRVGGEERKARCFAAHITHDPWPRAHALRRTLRTACFFPGVLGARFFCAALDLGGIVGAKRRALTRRSARLADHGSALI